MSKSASSGAAISDCGDYRYALTRGDWLDGEGTVLFVMLNPSTADASVDDPTIRRCIGFAQRWGYARLQVANLYALRATNPRELFGHPDPVGPENHQAIRDLASSCTDAIVAWGATPHPQPHLARQVLALLEFFTGSVRCLGQTKDLHPRHPLYVSGATPRVPFKRYATVA